MIILKLKGGLGNQLFQYAAGMAVASKNNDILKIDNSDYIDKNRSFKRETLRKFDISDFMIKAQIASISEIQRIKYPYKSISAISRIMKQKILRQYYVDWHPNIFKKVGDLYLEGYFQSENYFTNISDLILSEYVLRPNLAAEIEPLLSIIKSVDVSVSIHIRRGDYVSNARVSRSHLICGKNYYEKALSEILRHYPSAHVFVFSDDQEWVKNNINFQCSCTLISSNPEFKISTKPSQELILMANCKHNIISNSTFSWWGAYLNRYEKKIILAPSVWTRGPYSQANILPEKWTILTID